MNTELDNIPLRVKIDRSKTSFNLNGYDMKMILKIKCNKEYKSRDNPKMIEEIYAAVEAIMQRYSILNW